MFDTFFWMLLFSFADASEVYSETQMMQTSFYFCEGIFLVKLKINFYDFIVLGRLFILHWIKNSHSCCGWELKEHSLQGMNWKGLDMKQSSQVTNMLYDKNK